MRRSVFCYTTEGKTSFGHCFAWSAALKQRGKRKKKSLNETRLTVIACYSKVPFHSRRKYLKACLLGSGEARKKKKEKVSASYKAYRAAQTIHAQGNSFSYKYSCWQNVVERPFSCQPQLSGDRGACGLHYYTLLSVTQIQNLQ